MEPSNTAKQRLMSYRSLKEKIMQAENEIAALKTDKPNSFSRPLIIDLHNRIRELSEQCLEIDREVEKLPTLEQVILRYRYIFDCPWEDICDKIGYEFEHVSSIHKRALTMFSQNMK